MDALVLICYVLLGTSPIEQTCHVEDADYNWVQYCSDVGALEADIVAALNNRSKWRLSVCRPYTGDPVQQRLTP